MGKVTAHPLILAISPTSHGMAYALFDKPTSPLDWGIKKACIQKEKTCTRHLQNLIDLYEPDALIMPRKSSHPKRTRIPKLVNNLAALAQEQSVQVFWYARSDVQTVFGQFGRPTKFGIAETICGWFPELRPRMPRNRRLWMPEDYTMAIFDVIALAITHYFVTD